MSEDLQAGSDDMKRDGLKAGESLAGKNQRVARITFGVVVAMVGLAFAAVPLYDAFCRVTGWGGTTQVAEADQARDVLDATIKIRFNADTHDNMAWNFKPKQKHQTLKIGEQSIAYYEAENPTSYPIAGQASYNVTPLKVGQYFNKIECFCFTEQVLKPGERMDMPVLYFIDPEFYTDPEMKGVKEITLSYTFYELEDYVFEEDGKKAQQTMDGDVSE